MFDFNNPTDAHRRALNLLKGLVVFCFVAILTEKWIKKG